MSLAFKPVSMTLEKSGYDPFLLGNDQPFLKGHGDSDRSRAALTRRVPRAAPGWDSIPQRVGRGVTVLTRKGSLERIGEEVCKCSSPMLTHTHTYPHTSILCMDSRLRLAHGMLTLRAASRSGKSPMVQQGFIRKQAHLAEFPTNSLTS